MILSILLCLAGGCSFVYLRMYRASKKVENIIPKPFLYRNPAENKDIISGKGVLEDTYLGPAATLLQSRAVPNERLIQAFGIDNAFTTTDEAYHKEFRRHAISLLQRDGVGWQHLRDVAQKLVRQGIETGDNSDGILLMTLVQKVVLKMSIHTMFGLSIDKLDDATIQLIADKISTLWMGSKNPDAAKILVSKDQHVLKEALRKIFPDMEGTARSNPLNLILPAYETLWRVVLRCFVEVMFRSGKQGPKWRRVLVAFLSNPTGLTFDGTSDADGGISVKTITAEALRLYPPTRRIYRQITRGFTIEPEIVAADIEYVQRDSRFWGADCLRFNPSRWEEVAGKSCDAYMPFGWKPFVCPAEKEFGPRMIGILVAALVSGFEEGWTWKAMRREDVIDNGEPLNLERESYKTLKLCKKPVSTMET